MISLFMDLFLQKGKIKQVFNLFTFKKATLF